MSHDLVAMLCRMARNGLLANDRIYRALKALRPGEFEAPRTSFFPSLVETMNHILSVDLYYLDAVEEGGTGLRVFATYVDGTDPAKMAADQMAVDRRWLDFCERLGPDDCARRVMTDRGDDGPVAERIDDLLVHIFTHDIHHRGQVHAMLSGTSVSPPQLDEYFLDFDLDRRRAEIETLAIGAR